MMRRREREPEGGMERFGEVRSLRLKRRWLAGEIAGKRRENGREISRGREKMRMRWEGYIYRRRRR